MIMQPKIKYKVKCSDREVGEVSRVIVDPIAKGISHIVLNGSDQERIIPYDHRVLVENGTVILNFPSSDLNQFPRLNRKDFVELKDVEIAGLEHRLEVVPGETLVPLPELEKDPSRRAFFIKFSNAIGVVLALPLVYPVLRYLTKPMYRPFDNSWIKIAKASQIEQVDIPKQVKFKKTLQEGYLEREFDKTHWVIRASEALREKIYTWREKLYKENKIEFVDQKGKVFWADDPNNEFVVFSGKCPHLGCAYRWKENHKKFGKVFWCPCHLSIYDPSGKVLDGPAPRPLDMLPTRVTPSGDIEIVDTEFKAGKTHMIRIV
jgi:Rieske Fe-S protein